MKKILLIALFWLVQLTWGFIENFIGALIFVFMILTGHTPKRFHQMFYFETKKQNWGGFNMGFVAVVNAYPTGRLLRHEHGHFIQTFYFGPFMIFIQIASAARYWYRKIMMKLEKYENLPPYDSIWFEGQATKLGDIYFLDKPLAKMRGKE